MLSENCTITVKTNNGQAFLIEKLTGFLKAWGWQITVEDNVMTGTWTDRSIKSGRNS